MAGEELSAVQRYRQHLRATIAWLLLSFRGRNGGSPAYLGVWGWWSAEYPETTGYIIPTLLRYAPRAGDEEARRAATAAGEWLLSIQAAEGFWYAGKHPPAVLAPSVFNTAQILDGLVALYRTTEESRWLDAAARGALWLARGIDGAGAWRQGNYNTGFSPSYYSQVAWPLLQVWRVTDDLEMREAAEAALNAILRRRRSNGVISGWGFREHAPAFTHTIAYTIRGFIESAVLLDKWEIYGAPIEDALETLLRKTQLSRGNLPGAFSEDWRGDKSFSCLTGNVQLASCLLRWNQRENDLRIVDGACKLVDFTISSQSAHYPFTRFRGAVAGSKPIWGRYMRFRYPNWAAKYTADALMDLIDVLEHVE